MFTPHISRSPIRRSRRLLLAAVSATVLVAAGCTAESAESTESTESAADPAGDESAATTSASDGAGLPQTEPANKFGVSWFSPPDADVWDTVASYWEDVADSVGVARMMIDWIDVEPERGRYDFDELRSSLDDLPVTAERTAAIVAVDTSGTEFPEWLGTFEPLDAAAAYNAMFDEALPVLQQAGVARLIIANEPPLFGDPGDYVVDPAEFAVFVATVVDHVRAVDPGLETTFTFAGTDALRDDPAIDDLVASVDVVSVNHFCLTPELFVIDDLADVGPRLDAYGDVAGDKPLMFQELGCPSGDVVGSSEQFQADWFAMALDHLRDDDQVVAAFVFEFHDWSPELIEGGYGDLVDLSGGFFARFADWLETTGLIARDGEPRPSWDVFTAAL